MAAMISLCEGINISANIFDENVFVQELEDNTKNGVNTSRDMHSS